MYTLHKYDNTPLTLLAFHTEFCLDILVDVFRQFMNMNAQNCTGQIGFAF